MSGGLSTGGVRYERPEVGDTRSRGPGLAMNAGALLPGPASCLRIACKCTPKHEACMKIVSCAAKQDHTHTCWTSVPCTKLNSVWNAAAGTRSMMLWPCGRQLVQAGSQAGDEQVTASMPPGRRLTCSLSASCAASGLGMEAPRRSIQRFTSGCMRLSDQPQQSRTK